MPLAGAASFLVTLHWKFAINSLFNSQGLTQVFSVLSSTGPSVKIDLSIEGMRSQQFSVGVFFFMLVSVLVFSGIVYSVAFGKHAPKNMKTGEKLMFGAIILGIVVAIVFGALQMLSGYLF
ncbi:MAG: hypothetical protein HY306_00880 [Nitrosomonadales bacterium]|nr:hypothetical protein [Nitrosomonadales bacterium]